MQCVEEWSDMMIKHGVHVYVWMWHIRFCVQVCGGWGFSLHSSKVPWIIQFCREPFLLRRAEQWKAGAKLGWVIPKCSLLHKSCTWTEVYLNHRSKRRDGEEWDRQLKANFNPWALQLSSLLLPTLLLYLSCSLRLSSLLSSFRNPAAFPK